MAEILDYFDSINIDVAKRKYYNVNKVNAVLSDLRDLAAELVEENERQRRELYQLRSELDQSKANDGQSREMLATMQELYRETLTKAHDRADGIVRDAEAHSEKLRQEAEQQGKAAAEQLMDCFQMLQNREEENIRFLNQNLARILSTIHGKNTSETTDSGNDDSSSGMVSMTEQIDKASSRKEKDNGVLPANDPDQLKTLELQIQRLAEEINALESGR